MILAQAGKAAAYGVLVLLIASCTSSRAPKPVAPGGPITGPVDYSRPPRDGAPWWDVDVSRIPDAVP
ncbi:MAG: septal ring lytic transglycosylase RlpA family lipoprotein, partial [Pseudomonas sp. PGPPP3]